MSSESSSGHTLNGDRNLSVQDRLRWLVKNAINNARANADLDPTLLLARFHYGDVASAWPKVDALASPARRLCDFFWLGLPWARIADEFGSAVRVLEVGCGTGRYGLLLQACLGEAFGGYVGLDIVRHSEWEKYRSNSKIKLIQADSGETQRHLADADLILTQSALEHFEQDLVFFRQIAAYVAAANRPIIQFHLIPSAQCLTTFPWHGVRQYTPRTVSRITRLFGAETSKRLYFLGSAACNRIHRRYITYPSLLRRGDQRQKRGVAYELDLRRAVQEDDVSPRPHNACFLSLVLQSRPTRDIFQPQT